MVKLDKLDDGIQPLPKLTNLSGSKPLIVLVNDETASAAEMLAAALKDNHRAILVGTKTYGKGITQSTHQGLFFDNSYQLTDSWWFTPSGVCIHREGGVETETRGIKPDFVVQQGKHGDAQLDFALNQLRKAIETK